MSEQAEQATDSEIQVMADEISAELKGAFDLLIEQRDTAYADAIAPLDAERANLAEEYSALSQASQNLEKLLPAMAREAQRQADALLVAGRIEESEAKAAEAQQAAHGLETMRIRQQEISSRLESIEEAKKAQARRVFRSWHSECKRLIRPLEHGLFVVILDGLQQSFFEFQAVTDTVGDGVLNTLFTIGDITDLTADERSPEWQSGTRWYSGRGRR